MKERVWGLAFLSVLSEKGRETRLALCRCMVIKRQGLGVKNHGNDLFLGTAYWDASEWRRGNRLIKAEC
jgi:hypothetical protein